MATTPSAALATKTNFVTSKAKNLKAYLLGFAPNAEAQAMMDGFDESQIIPTIMTKLVPMAVLCQLDKVVDAVMETLTVPENQVPEVRAKIMAYLRCFVDVMVGST